MGCCGLKCGILRLKFWSLLDFAINITIFCHGVYLERWPVFSGWFFFLALSDLYLFCFFLRKKNMDERNWLIKIWYGFMVIHIVFLISMWIVYPYFAFQGAQSFTSLMADLCQDIKRVSSFSRCLNGTCP